MASPHPPNYVANTSPFGTGPPAYDHGASRFNDKASESAFTFQNDAIFNSSLPATIPLKDKQVEPLVLPSDLRAHLLLLGAFLRLREEVCNQKGRTKELQLDADELWKVFLSKAVYRFQSWIQRSVGIESEEAEDLVTLGPDDLPPLDVVMVWHTYMLNPRIYYEDCLRYHRGLLRIGSFPLQDLAMLIDPDTHLPYPATSNRQEHFTSITSQPFAYQPSPSLKETLVVNCPRCSYPNAVKVVTEMGTGYTQPSFRHVCTQPDCLIIFTHETLGVRKFCEDVEKCIRSVKESFLSGTLVDYCTGVPKTQEAELLNILILQIRSGQIPFRPEELAATLKWSFAEVEALCRRGYLGEREGPWLKTPIGLNRVLRAYRLPQPFSIDLASAVLRQMSFVDTVSQLGWTEPNRFEDDSVTLTRSVVRYHAFLEMIASSTGKFAVPTLDIDLAWHTHQLLVDSYRRLHDLIGIIPDHDDKVEQGAITSAYDETAKLWKARFGVPYSVCGCLPPTTDKPQGNSFSLKFMKGKAKAPSAPPLQNKRPDLTSNADSDSAETHPSQHNAITVLDSQKEYTQKGPKRIKELTARAKDLEKSVVRGQTDGWGNLVLKRAIDPHHVPAFTPSLQEAAITRAEQSGHVIRGDPQTATCATGVGFNGMCKADFGFARMDLREAAKYSLAMQASRGVMDSYGMAFVASSCGFGGA